MAKNLLYLILYCSEWSQKIRIIFTCKWPLVTDYPSNLVLLQLVVGQSWPLCKACHLKLLSWWVDVFGRINVGSQWAFVTRLQPDPRNSARLKLVVNTVGFLESAISPVFLDQPAQSIHRDHQRIPSASFLLPPHTQLSEAKINHSKKKKQRHLRWHCHRLPQSKWMDWDCMDLSMLVS